MERLINASKADGGERDGRLSKQFGDFAEGLVMYMLGRIRGMTVALIDHVGADIIAVDRNSKNRYMVSVKGRNFPETESKGFVFTRDNCEKLEKISDDFKMIPAIAFVFVDEYEADSNGKRVMKIRILFIALKDLKNNAGNSKFLSEVEKGYSIRYEKKCWGKEKKSTLDLIRECDFIDYTEFALNSPIDLEKSPFGQ